MLYTYKSYIFYSTSTVCEAMAHVRVPNVELDGKRVERSRGLDLELTLTFAQYSQNYACMMRAQTIFFVIVISSFMIFTFRLYIFFYFMVVVVVVVDLYFIYLFIYLDRYYCCDMFLFAPKVSQAAAAALGGTLADRKTINLKSRAK